MTEEQLKRMIKVEIASHTQEHPEKIVLGEGLIKTIDSFCANQKRPTPNAGGVKSGKWELEKYRRANLVNV